MALLLVHDGSIMCIVLTIVAHPVANQKFRLALEKPPFSG